VYIAGNIASIVQSIPAGVNLVAVSKTKPVDDLLEAYHAGQKAFGENKVQEMVQKYEVLPKDIEWHFIGHPQTNKIRFIAPFVHLIHGVDSLKLLKVIDAEAKKNGRKINCLLQFHIAGESTKFGLNRGEAEEILNCAEFVQLKNVEIAGVMGMATFTNDEEQIRSEFRTLKGIFDSLKNSHFQTNKNFNVISMGMSDDYQVAIEEGSTMVRIGSKIFGERNY
jgi:pyridoxal phosphate enzyme (YggS family)